MLPTEYAYDIHKAASRFVYTLYAESVTGCHSDRREHRLYLHQDPSEIEAQSPSKWNYKLPLPSITVVEP